MHNVVSYLQRCPVCSRLLRIRVSFLGKQVYCQHCGGKFRASDPAIRPVAAVPQEAPAPADDLLQRVELALQRAEQAASARVLDGAVPS